MWIATISVAKILQTNGLFAKYCKQTGYVRDYPEKAESPG
jgi:hypothetical protein